MRQHDLRMESHELTAGLLEEVASILLAREHSQFDYEFIGRYAQLVVDTRNAMAGFPEPEHKVWKV